MLNDNIKLTGHVSIKKYNEKGELVQTKEIPNLVVNAGKAFIASRIISNTDYPVMNYMGVGVDASTATVLQTALVVEVARVEVNSSTASGANVTFTGIFPAGTPSSSVNLTECAIYNTPASAVLTFDGDNNLTSSTHVLTLNNHGYTTGQKVTYVDGGGTTINGLQDGGTYYVIVIDTNDIYLADTLAHANAGVFLPITDGSGANHKLIVGDMLARTTFPVITKATSETIAITWTITVG